MEQDLKNLSEEDKNRILQVHLAEYQLVGSRATNNINMSLVIFSAFLLLLSILVESYLKDAHIASNRIILFRWATLFLLQVFGIFALLPLWDEYLDILYSETELKWKIIALLPTKDILGYESFLLLQRNEHGTGKRVTQVEFWIWFVVSASFAYVFYKGCRSHELFDLYFFIPNAAVYFFFTRFAFKVINLKMRDTKKNPPKGSKS